MASSVDAKQGPGLRTLAGCRPRRPDRRERLRGSKARARGRGSRHSWSRPGRSADRPLVAALQPRRVGGAVGGHRPCRRRRGCGLSACPHLHRHGRNGNASGDPGHPVYVAWPWWPGLRPPGIYQLSPRRVSMAVATMLLAAFELHTAANRRHRRRADGSSLALDTHARRTPPGAGRERTGASKASGAPRSRWWSNRRLP